jgi:cytochrome c oxidase subunit 1
MGIVSEVLPVFSRKPIFGYKAVAISTAGIAFYSMLVWAHHMFAVGMPVGLDIFFMLSSMVIAVPTGVKIFNWLGTLWGGDLRFRTPMLFAIGFVAMFIIGGLSGIFMAATPVDIFIHDTYYIVAHFHYVVFGGIIMAFFGGLYYYWPKVFGFRLSDRWGKANFWLQLIGMNMTFGPMHILGLQGMSRRIDHYSKGFGFEFWNMVVSIGAFVIASSVACFLIAVVLSTYRYKKGLIPNAGPDPWDARNLEWMTTSPVPAHNFDSEIEVHGLDEFWHRKYGYDENHRVVRVAKTEDVAHKGTATNVHLPSPSYWPIVIACGLPLIAYGLIFNLWLCVPGAIIVLGGFYGFAMEPVDDPDAHHGGDGHDAAAGELAAVTAGHEEADHG